MSCALLRTMKIAAHGTSRGAALLRSEWVVS